MPRFGVEPKKTPALVPVRGSQVRLSRGFFAAFVAAAAGGLHDTHTSALASTLASQRKLSENQGDDCRKSQIESEQSGDIPDRNAHNFVEAFF